jgi:phage terminase large subunit
VTENLKFDPAEVIAAWARDPVAFVQQVLGAEPDEWQAEALNALVSGDKLAVRSGHGVGKTTFLAWTILWWLMTRWPARVNCTANTQFQLETVLWGEIAAWHRRMPPGMRERLEVKSDKVVFAAEDGGSTRGESGAFARTASKEKPEALQGAHSKNMLFIVDEASGVPDIIFEAAEGTLSTPGAKIVLTGNPTRPNGYFYDAFYGPLQHRWWKKRVSCFDVKGDYVSPTFIEDMKARYGEDSNVYRVRVLGEFPRQDDDTVIPLDWAESAVGRDTTAVGSVVWGLDVARSLTRDRSVLVKRQGNVVLEKPRIWRYDDLMPLVGAIVAEYRATRHDMRPKEILIDTIGLGAGAVDRLRELDLGPLVRGINVGDVPAANDRFVRLRDELWWAMREWFETREANLPFPKDEAFVNEICSPRYAYTSSGKIKVETKDEMRKRGVHSPDLGDALMLTFASSAMTMHQGGKWATRRRVNVNTGWVV